MTSTLSYTYAVARPTPDLAEALTRTAGVARAPVHLVHAAGNRDVAAVVSPVGADDFGQEALRRHLEDLDWLEAVARAHHGVVEIAAARTTVLPLRLATVHLDDGRVRQILDDRHDELAAQLDRIAHQQEWGVKLYLAPAADPPPPPADPDLTPGRAYLRGRRARRLTQEDARRAAGTAAARIEAVAGSHATALTRHPVQQGQLATGPGDNILNVSCLVPVAHADAFRDALAHTVDDLPAVRIDITGPWAPYSFAAAPGSAEPGPELP
ncbi:GvpL/GvpF family gas vesicle protein [Kitasatospora paranensis]|uniref:GvpL/GvpF family gas vesicle protein n=1 Tax=Kitasatospora paranensis TaxID=258053 RepID=A0ABW2GA75_9ACTN